VIYVTTAAAAGLQQGLLVSRRRQERGEVVAAHT
jgi:hypothetical protein